MLRGIVGKIDDMFCNSHFTMERAKLIFKKCSEPIFVGCGVCAENVPLPIEKEVARRHLNIDAQYVILTVARLVPRKGMDMVIRSLPKVLNRYPKTLYVVAGGGEDLARLKQFAKENGVAEKVRFDGEIERRAVHYYYCAADLFVMPARQIAHDFEGFGIVYLEAGHYGLPVIGGRSGGISDAIVEGETGLLVTPEDPDDIALAIIRLLGDPELRKQYGNAGQKRVREELTWDAVAGRMIDKIGCGEAQ